MMLVGGSNWVNNCCFNSCSSFKLTPSWAIADVWEIILISDLCDELKVSFGDLTDISFTPSYQSWGQTPCSSLVKPITMQNCQKSLKSFLSLPACGLSVKSGPFIGSILLTSMAMTGIKTPRFPAQLLALITFFDLSSVLFPSNPSCTKSSKSFTNRSSILALFSVVSIIFAAMFANALMMAPDTWLYSSLLLSVLLYTAWLASTVVSLNSFIMSS